jgi:hypothetical protein
MYVVIYLKYLIMNKKEILKKYLRPLFNTDEEMEETFCNKWDELEKAMDEYANQQHLGFDLTCDNCGCHASTIFIASHGRFCEHYLCL